MKNGDYIYGWHYTVALWLPLAILRLPLVIIPAILLWLAAECLASDQVYLIALPSSSPEVPQEPPVAQVELFPMSAPVEPTTIPVTFAAFDAPVTNVDAEASTPAIAEFMREGDPGDILTLTVEDSPTAFVAFGTGLTNSCTIYVNDGQELAVELPDGLPSNDAYLLVPTNANGYGEAVLVNRTELWWVDDYVATGDTFRIYGRNLCLGGTTNHLYIDELDEWIESTDANPYMAQYTLPATATAGTYTVYSHNGHGQEYGWSEPLEITVWNGAQWDSGTTYNVTNHSLVGDGETDNTSAFATLYATAKSDDWPTVYFPAGTYLFSGSEINMWETNLRFLGDGTNSIIKCANATASKGSLLINHDHVRFEDITIQTAPVAVNDSAAIKYSSGSHISYEGVRFDDTLLDKFDCLWPTNRQTLWTEGTTVRSDIRFTDCDIVSSRHWDTGGRNVVFERCNFWGLNDMGGYLSLGVNEFAMINSTNHTSYDMSDPTDWFGWGKGRWINAGGNHPSAKWYVGNCVATNANARYYPGLTSTAQPDNGVDWLDWNAGEQIMSEGGTTYYRAPVVSATSNTLTISAFDYYGHDIDGLVCAVVGGKGLGQSVLVESETAGTYTLRSNWRVIPDNTSVVAFGLYAYRWVVYGNKSHSDQSAFDAAGLTTACSFFQLSSGGGAQEVVVAGNLVEGTRSGITFEIGAHTNSYSGVTNWVSPVSFNLFRDNVFTNIDQGVYDAVLNRYDGKVDIATDYMKIGNALRRNQFNSVSNSVYVFDYWTTEYNEADTLTVWQDNVATDIGSAYSSNRPYFNAVWNGNTTNGASWEP